MSNDFLELLESFTAEEASVQRLFGAATARASARCAARTRATSGPWRRPRTLVRRGPRPAASRCYLLQEAMSTSDFPLLFGDIIDRQLLGIYQTWPVTWSTFARRGPSAATSGPANLFTLDGAEGALSKVPQGAPYPEGKVNEGRYQYKVEKYGRQLPFLWEVFVNDDLESLRDMPNRLAIAARVTEERLATELFVDSTGPDATFYSSGTRTSPRCPRT
jgi:hypothetical protein